MMHSRCKQLQLLLFLFVVAFIGTDANSQWEISNKARAAPHGNMGRNVIDGSGGEKNFHDIGMGEKRGSHNKVSVSTVTLFTLAMAAATGLGAVPFFFIELDPQWAGICNGMAAGVMLAASFDFVKEGQEHGSGNWVVIGILAGGLFIWLCKKILEQYGEVSVLDIKGAASFFWGGIRGGVAFAGSKGFSQGLLVTLAIAVHNMPEGLAVSMVLASRGVSPQNVMLWSTITSLRQRMLLASLFHSSLVWVVFLVALALTFHLQHAFLMGIASGIAFVLGLWRLLQLLLSAKMGFIPMVSLLIVGAALSHFMSLTILNVTFRKKSRAGSLINSVTNFSTSAITLQSLLACGAVGFHALAEGLALGVAALKAYGLGRHMVLLVSLHGFPRGTAVASCVLRVTDSWHAALAAAALIGFVGPISAIGSILAGIDY